MAGNTVSIPAKGTNEFILVTLDEIEVTNPTSSGDSWEYGLFPSTQRPGIEMNIPSTFTLRTHTATGAKRN